MKYTKIEKNSIANGIGIRVVLWCQGCSLHCKGCHNPQTWDFTCGQRFNVDAIQTICEELQKPYVTGLTLSGGHPLEPQNIQECTALCMYLKLRFPDKTIWLYTGWTWESIWNSKHDIILDRVRQKVLSMCDVVVDGSYIDELKDITLKWCGSKNQRVIDVKKTLEENTIVLYCD